MLNLSPSLFFWFLSWLMAFSISVWWSKKFKSFQPQGLLALCTWSHLLARQQPDRWRYFLLVKSTLARSLFSWCRLVCSDFARSFTSHSLALNWFPFTYSIISFFSRFSSFRQLLLLYYTCYSCDRHHRSRNNFFNVGLFEVVNPSLLVVFYLLPDLSMDFLLTTL